MNKFLALVLFALVCAPLWPAEPVAIEGQRRVAHSMLKWGDSLKTRLLFLGNNVYLDTSSTGQANAWKRIDNTADSCSKPVLIAWDSLGLVRPVWEYRLWGVFRSVDADSGAHYYRVQTREMLSFPNKKAPVWTPWSRYGKNSGYNDVSIQDSVAIPSASTVTKVSQYSLFFVSGTQARFCPDDAIGTANGASDSVFADSLRVLTR